MAVTVQGLLSQHLSLTVAVGSQTSVLFNFSVLYTRVPWGQATDSMDSMHFTIIFICPIQVQLSVSRGVTVTQDSKQLSHVLPDHDLCRLTRWQSEKRNVRENVSRSSTPHPQWPTRYTWQLLWLSLLDWEVGVVRVVTCTVTDCTVWPASLCHWVATDWHWLALTSSVLARILWQQIITT